MCDCGVPDRHTTAVSSSKIGARNVAPASATHATIAFGGRVHQLEHVVGRAQHAPRAAHRRRVEHLRTAREVDHRRHCNHGDAAAYDARSCRTTTSTTTAGCCSTRCACAGVVDGGDEVVDGARRRRPASPSARPKGLRLTPEGRELHTAWARVEPGGELEAAVERVVPALPRAQPRADPRVQRLAGPARRRAERPRATRPTTGRSSTGSSRSTTASAPILRTPARASPGSAPTARGYAHAREPCRRRRARVAHVAAHRLVPHGVDAAPRRPAARARPRPRVGGRLTRSRVLRVFGRHEHLPHADRRARRRRAGTR